MAEMLAWQGKNCGAASAKASNTSFERTNTLRVFAAQLDIR